MTSLQRKLVLGGIVVLSGLLLLLLAWYDRLRMSDIHIMSEVRILHTGLEEYFRDHAGYPSSSSGQLELGVQKNCLSESGFIGKSGGCTPEEHAYVAHIRTNVLYRPLNKDGSLCEEKTPCAWYELQFSLASNMLLKNGIHIQTPTTLK